MTPVGAPLDARLAGCVLSVVAVVAVTGCTGGADGVDAPAAPASSSPAAAPGTPAPPPGASPSPGPDAEPTADPGLVERALQVQSAQQALADGGRGTFVVRLVDGGRGGVLPSVEGAYDVAVPAGEFTAVTDEADRQVTLNYRTRGARAWSQVLYPGSPLAPDCWYQLSLAPGAVALPTQVSALLYLEPDPAEPDTGTTVLLGDALNAVGLTRLANLLGPETAEVRVPVEVALRGAGTAARFTSWGLAGEDLRAALQQTPLTGSAQRALAEVVPVLRGATWRVVLSDGEPGRIVAPDRRTVLLAGDSCPGSPG